MYKYKCRVRGDKVRGNTGYQDMIRCKACDGMKNVWFRVEELGIWV